jgi:hypothetical protein
MFTLKPVKVVLNCCQNQMVKVWLSTLLNFVKPILSVVMVMPVTIVLQHYCPKIEKKTQHQGKWKGLVDNCPRMVSAASDPQGLDQKGICRSLIGVYIKSTEHARINLEEEPDNNR